MNTIFIFLLIIIFILTLFLANVNTNVNTNVTEGYKNKAMDFADNERSRIPTYSITDLSPTSAQINYDAKTYDSSATIRPGTTLGPFTPDDSDTNNYDLQYHDDIQSKDISGN